ncbi:MerR family transcriptional regulator [Microlunatus elymi]|uniref:MerR family transcriptional regulator n=1 Tax=Microlunatus elymi TaxID=2596828 RepID=A0A516Q2T8_9ACTN|nr:MerR family transcriptional regulator [Microlunatus elymi]QDP97736.1 MerR family transcriptional regulator [Microlunatus elymi]
MRDELMTIGSFSMLSGLSIATLRHYDEIGLLRPAEVDVQSSYRLYARDQVDVGRRVRLLREAGLSTDQIARILAGDDSEFRAVLAERRAALEQRTLQIQTLLDQLLQANRDGTSPSMQSAADFRLTAVNIGVNSETALETARRFWGDVLGTELDDWGNGAQQVVLGQGDNIGFLNISIRSSEEARHTDAAAFGLGVPGLDDTHQRALTAGATEQYPPTDGISEPRHSLIIDPVGNRVVLWESER